MIYLSKNVYNLSYFTTCHEIKQLSHFCHLKKGVLGFTGPSSISYLKNFISTNKIDFHEELYFLSKFTEFQVDMIIYMKTVAFFICQNVRPLSLFEIPRK